MHKDSDFIVSLNIPAWANGAHCGQTVKVADASTGKTVTVTVADECPTCGAGGIDLSVGAFEALTGALFPESASGEFGVVVLLRVLLLIRRIASYLGVCLRGSIYL